MSLIISIVGRPNTGKSTLFNSLTESNRSMTDDFSGITRDTIYGTVDLDNGCFTLVDTGGLMLKEKDTESLNFKVNQLVLFAIDESDAVIFLTDRKVGFHPDDQEILRQLRKIGKRIFFCVNKVDDDAHMSVAAEFYESGESDLMFISSSHKKGLGELKERISEELSGKLSNETDDSHDLALSIIGRPNAGKSTLVNRLLGEDKQLTHDMAGTTRESVDNFFKFHGKSIKITDTAGIRRKARVKDKIEKLSVLTAIRSVSRAEVVILMLDATEYAVDQDLKLAAYVKQQGKPMIIAVNKWDVLEKDSMTHGKLKIEILDKFSFANYCPVVFISALNGQRVHEMVKLALSLKEKRNFVVSQARLIKFLKQITEEHNLPLVRGRKNQVTYGIQVKSSPPVFVFRAKYPDDIPASHTRYVERRLREKFDLSGIPIKIVWEAK